MAMYKRRNMDFITGITAFTAVAAAAGYVAKASADYSKVKTRLDHLDEAADALKSKAEAQAAATREKLHGLSHELSIQQQQLQHTESRIDEDRVRADKKFAELGELKDETRQTLIELQASVDTLSRLFESRFASLEKQLADNTAQIRELSKITRRKKDGTSSE